MTGKGTELAARRFVDKVSGGWLRREVLVIPDQGDAEDGRDVTATDSVASFAAFLDSETGRMLRRVTSMRNMLGR